MPSSISHSDAHKAEVRGVREGALPAGLRQTAANRPGQAQPVPTRDIPTRPWVKMGAFVLCAVTLMTAAWEWNARANLGLRAGDIDDSPQSWAEQRRLADAAPAVIVGDSRILFDTDLDRFEALTGVRPIQLAIHGTSALTLLETMADDPDFKGVLIVGLADTMFFQPFDGYGGYVKKWHEYRAPYRIVSNEIDHVLQRRIAFLDSNYRLSVLAQRLDRDFRPGVEGPADDIWKLQEVGEHRQTWMWDRVEYDPAWRARTRWAWKGFKDKFPYTPKLIASGQARAKAAVDKIRARGGDVIFIRPPSAPQLRVNEEAQVPKAKGWDVLLRNTHSVGIHIDDLPAAQGLTLPEWSHLSRRCATVFTDAYVRRMAELTPRFKLLTNAPAPLSAADCTTA